MQVMAQSRNPVRYGKGSCAVAQVGHAVPLLAYTMTGTEEKRCMLAKTACTMDAVPSIRRNAWWRRTADIPCSFGCNDPRLYSIVSTGSMRWRRLCNYSAVAGTKMDKA